MSNGLIYVYIVGIHVTPVIPSTQAITTPAVVNQSPAAVVNQSPAAAVNTLPTVNKVSTTTHNRKHCGVVRAY